MKTYFYIFFVILAGLSCNNDLTDDPGFCNPIQLDDLPGACPNTTLDASGNIVVSWVRTERDSSHIFCYAVSQDEGRTFGKPVIIPASKKVHPHNENLPKVIFKPSGEIIAIWGAANPNPKNKYSGIIYYAQSFDEGKNWSAAKPLVNDTAGFDQRYFDVALLSNGEVGIAWLDNRKTIDKEGSGLYFATTNGKNGFENERLVTQPTCQCCRTDLYLDQQENLHLLYRGIIQDSIRDMLHIVSSDQGRTFTEPKTISKDNWVIYGCPHTGPSMASNKEGIHFAWFTGGTTKGSFYNQSRDNGNSFSNREQISEQGMHPQITSTIDENLMIVWDEPVKQEGTFNKRIGMQVRSSMGEVHTTGFITPATMNASYPVIIKTGDNILVAFSVKKDEKNYVFYSKCEIQNAK
jgi:hypothetical protein